MSEKPEVPYFAPGCFGSALNYRADDMVCNACPFKETCEPAHQYSLEKLRERLGIEAPVHKHKPQAQPKKNPDIITAANDDPTRLSLPKKVQELLVRLDRQSLDIVGSMKAGKNPFIGKKGFGYMAIACHMIMRFEGDVTHGIISRALQKKNNWTAGTADAHARMAAQALEHVGAIENTDGILTVRG